MCCPDIQQFIGKLLRKCLTLSSSKSDLLVLQLSSVEINELSSSLLNNNDSDRFVLVTADISEDDNDGKLRFFEATVPEHFNF